MWFVSVVLSASIATVSGKRGFRSSGSAELSEIDQRNRNRSAKSISEIDQRKATTTTTTTTTTAGPRFPRPRYPLTVWTDVDVDRGAHFQKDHF